MKQLLILFSLLSLKLTAQTNFVIAGHLGDGSYVSKECLTKYIREEHQPMVNYDLQLYYEDTLGNSGLCSVNSFDIIYIDMKTFNHTDYHFNARHYADNRATADDSILKLIAGIKENDEFRINYNFKCTLDSSTVDTIKNIYNVKLFVNAYTNCNTQNETQLIYTGKLLTGKNRDIPLTNQKLVLKDNAQKPLQSAVTDKYGDYSFKAINSSQSYNISLDGDVSKVKDNVVYMARVDGTIVNSFEKNGNTFSYSLLPAELNTLTKIKAEDTELKLKDFGKSKENNLIVTENIYYPMNSSSISPASIKNLDRIIKAMQDNKALKLTIASHTDAKGDDASNMTLSENRANKVMDYFVSKGIDKERLTAKGYGETQIKNRCKNGVDCSEMENELNRRTEFKFTK